MGLCDISIPNFPHTLHPAVASAQKSGAGHTWAMEPGSNYTVQIMGEIGNGNIMSPTERQALFTWGTAVTLRQFWTVDWGLAHVDLERCVC